MNKKIIIAAISLCFSAQVFAGAMPEDIPGAEALEGHGFSSDTAKGNITGTDNAEGWSDKTNVHQTDGNYFDANNYALPPVVSDSYSGDTKGDTTDESDHFSIRIPENDLQSGVGGIQVAKPERTTVIELSNRDANRIKCASGDINDIDYSEEKANLVGISGQNAFIKYQIREHPSITGKTKKEYVTIRTEFYVTCNGEIYTLLAYPRDIPARTILLVNGTADKMKQNVSKFEGMELEERVVAITQEAIREELSSSYTVTQLSDKPLTVLNRKQQKIKVHPLRSVKVDGMGLRLTEYALTAKNVTEIDERDFMNSIFGENQVGISMLPENHLIDKNHNGRLYIVSVTSEDF